VDECEPLPSANPCVSAEMANPVPRALGGIVADSTAFM